MGDERKAWIDVARGASIVMVTLFHATFITESAFGARTGIWPVVNEALIPIRMPLFFFISGLLAATAIHKPLLLTRRRTLGFAYLYLVWTVIQLALDLYLASETGTPRPSTIEILITMVLPTGLWFLWALAVYFVVARGLVLLLGRFAPWGSVPALVLAAVLPFVDEITSGVVNPFFGAGFFGSVCANFIWFYVGLFARRNVGALAARPSRLLAVSSCFAYGGFYAVASEAGVTYEARWLLSIVALGATVSSLVLIRGRSWGARVLSWVGRRTLPVYVMQWAALFVIAKLVLDVPLLTSLLEVGGQPDVLATVAGLGIAISAITVTALLGGLIARSPARWLLEPPVWLVGAPRARVTRGPVAWPNPVLGSTHRRG